VESKSALLSGPLGSARGGQWQGSHHTGSKTSLEDLHELSDADTVSTTSTVDSPDVTEQPATAHGAQAPSGPQAASKMAHVRGIRASHNERDSMMNKRRQRRMSTTIEGNIKAGTLADALGMPLGDEETMLVAQSLMQDAADDLS
jgi:hypothetical protein